MRAIERTMLAVLAAAALLAACDRQNPGPPDGGRRPDAGRLDAAVDGGELADAGDAGPTADGGDAGEPVDGGCVSDPSCWSCPPVTGRHFLNACTDSTCEPFPVTRERLPLLRADGTVPPLP